MLHPVGLGARAESAARLAGALAFTAFIGWYALDFAQTRGSTTIEFAVWFWVALLGWLVVVLGILGVQPDLGERYHGTRAFERGGRLYGRLRVPTAKKFMPNGDYAIRLVRRFRPGFTVISDLDSASKWELTTRSKEASHLIHLGLTMPLAVYLLANRALAATAVVIVLDVAFDLYPMMAQRYNRMRIRRVLGRHAPAPARGAPVDTSR